MGVLPGFSAGAASVDLGQGSRIILIQGAVTVRSSRTHQKRTTLCFAHGMNDEERIIAEHCGARCLLKCYSSSSQAVYLFDSDVVKIMRHPVNGASSAAMTIDIKIMPTALPGAPSSAIDRPHARVAHEADTMALLTKTALCGRLFNLPLFT